MSDVVDDSQSTEVLDDATLLPLSKSAGVLADDPDVDSDSEKFPNQGNVDDFDLEADEEPGRETRPDESVSSPDEDIFVPIGGE